MIMYFILIFKVVQIIFFGVVLILIQGYVYCLLILETEEGRERSIDVREKHRSVASCMHPNRELNPQTRYVP